MTNGHKLTVSHYYLGKKDAILGTKERKEREREQRREHIIKVSEVFFLNKSIDAVTMDEIAAECELSKGTLYIYFKSKEEIYLTIICRALSLLYGMFKEAVSKSGDPAGKLRTMGEAFITFYERYPGYYKLMVKLHDHQMFLKMDIKEVTGEILVQIGDIFSIMYEIIEEGKNIGLFKDNTNPAEVAISLWSVSTMFIGLIDHMETFDHTGVDIKYLPFKDLNMKSLLILNGKRVIYSILKNPPPDFDAM